jgi:hypothetical protein
MILPELSFTEGDAPDQAETTAGAQAALTCPSVAKPTGLAGGKLRIRVLTKVSPFSTAGVTIYKESDCKCQAIELMNLLQ